MTSATTYRFRLCLASRQAGKFAFAQSSIQIAVSETVSLELAARNADNLEAATNFHIEGAGFSSPGVARVAAEALRLRLRLLNALLGLGLNVPIGDTISSQVSEEIKAKVKSEQAGTVIDGVWGVNIFPDDGQHFEYVLSGQIAVRPNDPAYVFEGLRILWNMEISLDSDSEVALGILGLAVQEASEKASFLTTYLALEQLVDRQLRSEVACEVLSRFKSELTTLAADPSCALTDAEAKSISGSLSSLVEESFPSALVRLGKKISAPSDICGMKLQKFLSICVEARNRIAHKAEPEGNVAIVDLTRGLREFVLRLIWTRNNLSRFSISTPPSAVSVPNISIIPM
ncbi:MAG: hypothetical protein AB7V46_16535 [Thermomicrobiales bacterium]